MSIVTLSVVSYQGQELPNLLFSQKRFVTEKK